MKRPVVAGTALLLAPATCAGTANASCIRMTAVERNARAAIVFDGIALSGPTTTGIQLSASCAIARVTAPTSFG